MSDASTDDRALLLQLVKEVLDRLNDLEEQVSGIFTQVRLQARQHSTTASQLQLSLSHLGSNAGGSDPASPRGTATPSTASPRNNGRVAAGSLNNGSTAGGTCLIGSTISSTQRPAATAVTAGASASTDAAVQDSGNEQLGMFGAMKNWAQGATGNDQLPRLSQMATDALAAAEVAQATAVRCQQQVMEMMGRHGAAERRLDTLWQLQDSSAQTDAAADKAGAAAVDGLSKCELLRQAGVLVERRVEAMPGLIQQTVQPLQDRLANAEASLCSLSAATSVTKSVVQPEQLSSAVAQLSTASKRQQQQLAVQLAGLAGRLEALEDDAARREQVVSQDDFKQQISQLHACLDGAVSQASHNLHSKLANKADVSQLTATNSNLAARLDSSERRLMQGLKLLADNTTAALQLKADDNAVRDSSRKVADELADIRAQAAAAGTRLAEQHSTPSQPRLCSETVSLDSTSAQTGEALPISLEELSDDVSAGGPPLQAVALCGNAIRSSMGMHHEGPAEATAGMERVLAVGKADMNSAQQQSQQGLSPAGASTGQDETGPVSVLSAVRPDALPVVGHQKLLALGAAVASDSLPVVAGSSITHSGPAAADHCHFRSTSRGQQNAARPPPAQIDKLAEADLITTQHIRPGSTLRPWSIVTSSPSPASLRKTGNGAVLSAAHNAKLVKAGKYKQAMQHKIMQTGSNMKPDPQ
eukprot:gene12491-12625_t